MWHKPNEQKLTCEHGQGIHLDHHQRQRYQRNVNLLADLDVLGVERTRNCQVYEEDTIEVITPD